MLQGLAIGLVFMVALGKVANSPTLMLNMLVREEEDHLSRTLPLWGSTVDYWVIGLERDNTDHSRELIEKHLGHLPGEIIEVDFVDMGTTWNQVMKFGIDKFPAATHGIMADADFTPTSHLLKSELDLHCPKQLYTVLSEHESHTLDWVYRNVEGARVKGRAHQYVVVDGVDDSKCKSLYTTFQVVAHPDGFQDRSGVKLGKYAQWLQLDLADNPNDSRTMFYLAQAYLDLYFKHRKSDSKDYLSKLINSAIDLYIRRSKISLPGYDEERYYSLLRLGQIHDDILHEWNIAESYYKQCIHMDSDIADPYFYLGQHYRRVERDRATAYRYLKKAATIDIPSRHLVTWMYLYQCLIPLELGRAAFFVADAKGLDLSFRALRRVECEGEDARHAQLLLNDMMRKVGNIE